VNSLPPSAASTVKSGAATPGLNSAHAAVVKTPKQREKRRVVGFTGRILLFGARLAAIQPTHNAIPIKSMLIDRKIVALRPRNPTCLKAARQMSLYGFRPQSGAPRAAAVFTDRPRG
jgi:hypothetical protein